jgi:hypothetical protein
LAPGIAPSDFHRIALAFKNLEEYIARPTEMEATLKTVRDARAVAWRASGVKKGLHGTDTAPDEPEHGPQSE